MRRRILYIMHVDWDWAKQRPHFLAEHLSAHHDVLVLYPYARVRKNLVKNDRTSLRLLPFFPIASTGGFLPVRNFINGVSRILMRMVIRWHRPDLVWISSPDMFDYLPKPLPCRLVYDCMDDILAFPSNLWRKDWLGALEADLIHASDCVFCSSNNLRRKLSVRSGSNKKLVIVHNAFEPAAFAITPANSEKVKLDGRRIFGYIGTISSWFDFETLLRVVNEFKLIEIHILGPNENMESKAPRHERIKYLGAVRHDTIPIYVSQFDALIMPFKVIDLIRSVDPVKLYEYVYFNKPIVSVWYEEIDRFSEFADFYTTHQELSLIIDRYLKEGFKKKYTDAQQLRFINSNTWEDRVQQIQEYLYN